jgi:hypothetical protein
MGIRLSDRVTGTELGGGDKKGQKGRQGQGKGQPSEEQFVEEKKNTCAWRKGRGEIQW